VVRVHPVTGRKSLFVNEHFMLRLTVAFLIAQLDDAARRQVGRGRA
jgi:hypothetical protein